MKELLNFAHPLSADALRDLETLIGDQVRERVIKIQLDIDQPLLGQLDDLLVEEGFIACITPDLLIPPSFSAAAALLVMWFLHSQGQKPKVVWLKRPCSQFVLGGAE